jgi:GT2 family glycosyltransferase
VRRGFRHAVARAPEVLALRALGHNACVPLVSVGIVTWNAGPRIDACLASVRAQTYEPLELLVADNASADDTWARIEARTSPRERRRFAGNLGFAAAHNALIRESRGDFYLALNPDVVLDAEFVAHLVDLMARRPAAGSATGKLLREGPSREIDSTGIVMRPEQRHLDRGAGEIDRGQYDREEEVFGVSGAAGFYRRAMLEDVAIFGEYFDEDFFAYREDADLAWRARLLGWEAWYVPSAVATHARRVTPERRASLPPEINRWSVRNRFLLRLKNQPAGHALRFLVPALVRDLQVVGYVALRERSSLAGLGDVVRLLPRAWRKRRAIMRRRVLPTSQLNAWFAPPPRASRAAGEPRGGDRE